MAKKTDQPVFEVQVNLVYRLHAKDKLNALDKVLRPLSLLNPPGGLSREVKWNGVKDA
jgi:hypothetical protein